MNGVPYKISPSVANKDSWKPTSHRTSGLKRAIKPAAKARVFNPTCRLPTWIARSVTAPMMAARTTLGEAPTKAV